MFFDPQRLRPLRAEPDERSAEAQSNRAAKRETQTGRHTCNDSGGNEPADQNDAKDEKGEKHRLAAARSGLPIIYADGNAFGFRLRRQRIADRVEYRLDRTHQSVSR